MSQLLRILAMCFLSQPAAPADRISPDVLQAVERCRKQLAQKGPERIEAANEVRRIGAPAKAALPDLLRIVMDPETYRNDETESPEALAARSAIARIAPPEYVAEFLTKVRELDRRKLAKSDQQHHALLMLIEALYRPNDSEIERLYCDALEQPKNPIRAEMAEFVGKRVRWNSALPLLLRMTSDGDHRERMAAVVAIGSYGSLGSEEIAALDRVQRNHKEDEAIRTTAIGSLGSAGRESKNAFLVLCDIARNDKLPEKMRRHAIVGIGMNKHGDAFLPELLAIADPGPPDSNRDREHEISVSALDAVSRLNPKKESLRNLIWILTDALRLDDQIAKCRIANSAIAAIAKIGPDAKEAMPTLSRCLEDREFLLDERKFVDAILRIQEKQAATEYFTKRLIAINNADASTVSNYNWVLRELKSRKGP